NKKILSELEDVNKVVLSKNDELTVVTEEKSTVLQSKLRIEEARKAKVDKLAKEKEDQERLAKEKEEQEKIAKEKAEKDAEEKRLKAEADRLAREEEAKKAQEQDKIANNKQNTSTPQTKPPANNNKPSSNVSNGNNVAVDQAKDKTVYKTATGSKYHSHNKCGKSNPSTTHPLTVRDAESMGLGPCAKCF
ncbi:MAG: hypothetical protein ACRC7R_05855, partial [Sarcina sp.]